MSGAPSSFLPTVEACNSGSPPANCDGLKRLDTLANIVAGCVDSKGPSSIPCVQLFCDATPGLFIEPANASCSGTPAPIDTLGAAHLIVTNPANNVSALFGLASVSAPFAPTLATAPDGWEMALNFAPVGASFVSPVSIALDGSGNVFVANFGGNGGNGNIGSVSELTAASGYGTGLNFAPAGASFSNPRSIALDGSGNVFVANEFGGVSELTVASSYGTGLSFQPAAAAFDAPFSIALDRAGNVFVANEGGNSVSELTAGSGYGTGLKFAPAGAALDTPESIAVDGSSQSVCGEFRERRERADGEQQLRHGPQFRTCERVVSRPRIDSGRRIGQPLRGE